MTGSHDNPMLQMTFFFFESDRKKTGRAFWKWSREQPGFDTDSMRILQCTSSCQQAIIHIYAKFSQYSWGVGIHLRCFKCIPTNAIYKVEWDSLEPNSHVCQSFSDGEFTEKLECKRKEHRWKYCSPPHSAFRRSAHKNENLGMMRVLKKPGNTCQGNCANVFMTEWGGSLEKNEKKWKQHGCLEGKHHWRTKETKREQKEME